MGLAVLYMFGYWFVIVFLFHTMLAGGTSQAPTHVLIDYVQTVMLVMPMNVVAIVLGVFNLELPSGGGICWFYRSYFGSFVQSLAIPVISFVQLLLGYGAMAVVARLFYGRLPSKRRWLYRPLLSLLLAVYTPITDAALSMLNWRVVGPWRVLTDSPGILAEGPYYQPYFVVSVVLAVVVTAGLPLTLLAFLWRRASTLQMEATKLKFGTLYERHKSSYPWWTLLVLCRRSAFASLMLITSVPFHSYAVAVFALLMHVMQLVLQPHVSVFSNVGEALSTGSLVIVTFTLASSAYLDVAPLPLRTFLGVVIGVTCLILLGLIAYASRHGVAQLGRRVRGAAASLWARLQGVPLSPSETDKLTLAYDAAINRDLHDDRASLPVATPAVVLDERERLLQSVVST